VHKFIIIEPYSVLFYEFLDGLVESAFQRGNDKGADYLIGKNNQERYEEVFDRGSNHCFWYAPLKASISFEPGFLAVSIGLGRGNGVSPHLKSVILKDYRDALINSRIKIIQYH
jgi:hypothetical protein